MQHSLPQVQVGISHAIASEVRHGVSPALSHLLPQVGPIAQLSQCDRLNYRRVKSQSGDFDADRPRQQREAPG